MLPWRWQGLVSTSRISFRLLQKGPRGIPFVDWVRPQRRIDEILALALALLEASHRIPSRGLFAAELLVYGHHPNLKFDFRRVEGPHPAAPERLGFISDPVVETAWFYELGLLLYQAFSGKEAWQIEDLRDLERSMQAPPPSLPTRIPRPLRAVIQRLLNYSPHERYQTSRGLAHDLRLLQLGEREFTVGREDRRRDLALPDLVGRRNELMLIDALFESRPLLVIEGESGVGKTRLLEEAADRARALDWNVVGFGGEPRRQTAWEQLLELFSRLDPSRGTEILRAVEGGSYQPEQHRENKAEILIEEGLSSLPSWLGGPTLVLFDDGQWINPILLKAGRHAARKGQLAVFQVGREGTFPNPRSSLDRLESDDVRALLQSMGGPLPGKSVSHIVESSSGLPFLAVEGLRGLRETTGEFQFRSSELGGDILTRRLALLSEEEESILALAAMTGRAPDPSAISQLFGLPLGRVEYVLLRASQQRLLYEQPGGRGKAFFHDRVRDALIQRYEPERRKQAHFTLGQWLESQASEDALIAYHYSRADRGDLAFPHAVSGARKAVRTGDLPGAETLFRLALSHRSTTQLLRELAHVLTFQGERFSEARELLERARGEARNSTERAQIAASLAQIEYRCDRPDLAMAHLIAALEAIGESPPIRRLTPAYALYEVTRQMAHLAGAWARLHSKPIEDEETFLLRYGLYKHTAETAFELGNSNLVVWAQFRLLNDLEKYVPTPELGVLYCYHLAVLSGEFRIRSLPGKHWRAGLVCLTRRGSLQQRGKAGVWLAMRHYLISRFSRAEACARKTINLLNEAGDLWEVQIAATNLSNILLAQGRAREAVEVAREAYYGSRRWNNALGAARALKAWAEASGGKIPRRYLDRELERQGTSSYRLYELVQAEAFLTASEGRFEEAADSIEAFFRSHQVFSSFRVLIYPHLVTWLRLALESQPAKGSLRRAYHHAARRLRTVWEYSPAFAHAQREWGLALVRKGRLSQAESVLKRSILAAQAAGQLGEEKQSRSAHDLLGRMFGWRLSEGERLPDRDDSASASNTQSVNSRLATFLSTAPALFENPAQINVLNRAAEALRAILKAEDVWMLRKREDGWLCSVENGPCPQEEAEHSICQGHPTLLTSPHRVAELSRLGVKSAVLVPIGSDNVLLLAHYHSPHAFGEDDLELCHFLSRLSRAGLKEQKMILALRDHKVKFTTLFENAAVGLQLIDLEGRLLSENNYLRELLSLGNEADLDPFSRLEPQDQLQERPLFQEMCQGERDQYALLLRHRRWDGSSAWTQVTSTLVRSATGRPSCVVRAIGDVSLAHLERVIDFGEQQKQLLAMDLHDGIAQSLLLAIQKTHSTKEREDALLAIRVRLNKVVDDIRVLHGELSSPHAANRTYRRALRDFLVNFSADSEIELTWRVRRRKGARWPRGLPSLFAYRILTEALSNVRRHSQAGKVKLTLWVGRRSLRGEVTDDGTGLTGVTDRSQLGLKGIRLRCELLGGRFDLRSLEKGTRLRFRLPVEEAPCE